MKYILITGIVLVLLSCNQNDPKVQFAKYLASLETINTPATIHQLKTSVTYDTALFRTFNINDAQKPCGKIMLGDTIVLLIEQNSSGENMVRTTSLSGTPLDTKILFAKSEECSNEYGYSCSRFAIINGDRTIVVTDSIRQSRVDKNGELVKNSEQLRTSQRNWTVDSSGVFTRGPLVKLDSIVIQDIALKLYDTAKYSPQLFPEEMESDDGHAAKVYFVDLESDRPNVIMSFIYAAGGNNMESEDVAIVYFEQKNGKWSISYVEVVPLEQLDNG